MSRALLEEARDILALLIEDESPLLFVAEDLESSVATDLGSRVADLLGRIDDELDRSLLSRIMGSVTR